MLKGKIRLVVKAGKKSKIVSDRCQTALNSSVFLKLLEYLILAVLVYANLGFVLVQNDWPLL